MAYRPFRDENVAAMYVYPGTGCVSFIRVQRKDTQIHYVRSKALLSGGRGRRFESSHSDQHSSAGPAADTRLAAHAAQASKHWEE